MLAAPTLDSLDNITINEDSGEQLVTLSGIADPDGYVPSSAATQWNVANGGNGHWYEVVDGTLKWSDAKGTAEQSGGYLATLTSDGENDFAKTLITGSTFLGGFQDTTATDYAEPTGGWEWVTGEEWDYAPWPQGGPDNSTFYNPNGENVLEIMGPSQSFDWNDANVKKNSERSPLKQTAQRLKKKQ